MEHRLNRQMGFAALHQDQQIRDSFRFTGTIKQVVTDISGELIEDDEAKVRMLMAHQ